MVNLSAAIRFHALRTPEHTALVYQDQRVSYAEFHERLRRLAGLLALRGVGPGAVVAAFMGNSAAFLELAYALSHLGAVFLPINFRLAREEVRYILDHSDAVLLAADADQIERVGGIVPILLFDEAAQRDSRVLSHGCEPAGMAQRGPQDLFRLMYTSGTTDRPKGVMHTYENFHWKCLDHISALGLSANDRLLLVGPLYHVGAFDLPGVAALEMGATVIVQREFEAQQTLGLIERERVTGVWLAPVMLGRLLGYPDRVRFLRDSLRWCIGGGERTPESRIREFAGCFARARYIDAYGLTETCSGDTLMEAGRELEKIGSTGRAVAHMEISIRDEAGLELPRGTDGEICLRGPKVMRGYWKEPEKTARAFFGDWFRSGDIGRLDDEGFLTLTDRRKDMIISGGENIASSEVERVLFSLPQVAECAAVGVPDPDWGERVIAVIVPRCGESLDLVTVQNHCRAHLASFKVPRDLVLRDELPRNPSGKILKRVLREELCARQLAIQAS